MKYVGGGNGLKSPKRVSQVTQGNNGKFNFGHNQHEQQNNINSYGLDKNNKY